MVEVHRGTQSRHQNGSGVILELPWAWSDLELFLESLTLLHSFWGYSEGHPAGPCLGTNETWGTKYIAQLAEHWALPHMRLGLHPRYHINKVCNLTAAENTDRSGVQRSTLAIWWTWDQPQNFNYSGCYTGNFIVVVFVFSKSRSFL